MLLFHISGKICYVSSQDQMLLNRKEADTDSLYSKNKTNIDVEQLRLIFEYTDFDNQFHFNH